VPGQKTDVKDAEWHPRGTRQLLQHGLLRASCILPRDQRELAELVRYRRSLVEMRSAESNRAPLGMLEGVTIKLGSVLSHVLGVSGRAILERLIAGAEDGAVLAGLVHRTVRATRQEIARAAKERMGAHQRFLLEHQLALVDTPTQQIQEKAANHSTVISHNCSTSFQLSVTAMTVQMVMVAILSKGWRLVRSTPGSYRETKRPTSVRWGAGSR